MAAPDVLEDALTVDLATESVRQLNARLHAGEAVGAVRVLHPDGRHSIAVGLDAPYELEIEGHVGYYCAGMNKTATIRCAATAASAWPRT